MMLEKGAIPGAYTRGLGLEKSTLGITRPGSNNRAHNPALTGRA
ncbi:MAG: hypothetical protein R6W91_02250 [Thermoplasmata archaeon]